MGPKDKMEYLMIGKGFSGLKHADYGDNDMGKDLH